MALSDRSNIRVGLAIQIGVLIFASAIAYAKLSTHEEKIKQIEDDRKVRIEKTDERFQRMERLQYRMALKLRVQMDDLDKPEGE